MELARGRFGHINECVLSYRRARHQACISAERDGGCVVTNREFFIKRWEEEHSTFLKVFQALAKNKPDYRPHARARRPNWCGCWR
jgi:hypothetical protein